MGSGLASSARWAVQIPQPPVHLWSCQAWPPLGAGHCRYFPITVGQTSRRAAQLSTGRRRKAIGDQGSGLLKDNRALWPPYSLKGAVRTCLAA